MSDNIKETMNIYKQNAGTKGQKFELSNEQTKELLEGKCHWCDTKSSREYNRLDLTNSKKGYTIDNVTACCKSCFLIGYM